MGLFGHFLQQLNEGILWDSFSIVICAVFYFGILFLFPSMKNEIFGLIKRLIPRRYLDRFKVFNKKISWWLNLTNDSIGY